MHSLISPLKNTIKSTPFLYERLLPLVVRFRQHRRMRAKPKPVRELHRFRMLCKNLPECVPNPFFVKIGANDGISNDPCSQILLKDPRWKGVLIEPLPHCFEKLKINFTDPDRFILEPVAIGAKNGQRPFYYVDPAIHDSHPGLPPWVDRIGSFDRKHIVKHLKEALYPFITECSVEVRTLSDVLARNHVRRIDLLHIDAEGHDFEILKTVDFKTFHPTVIFLETNHLSDPDLADMHRLLRRNGYSVRNAGRDHLAVHRKTAARLRLHV